MKIFLLIMPICLVLIACKKDELKYEKSLLEGKWKWDHSVRFVTFEGTTIDQSIINANNYNDVYEVEFDRKGKVKYIKNNLCIDDFRIVFGNYKEFFYASQKKFKFLIYLSNRKKNSLGGNVSIDTLATQPSHLPLQNSSEGELTTSYMHYFIRNN